MPLRDRQGINAGWAAAVLILIVGGVSLWRLRSTLEVSRTTDHIATTLDSLDDLLSRLKDAETGQRGYVLTGDTAYLAPYHLAIDGVQTDVDALQQLMAGQRDDHTKIDALHSVIGRRLAEIDTTIALRRTIGFDASLKVIRTNAGKRSMDSVRAIVAALATSQQQRLADAQRRQREAVRFDVVVILSGTLAAFALALVAQGLVRSAGDRLRRTAAAQAATNAELEVKTQAADAASKAKSDFLAVMSHELRTPLNAILGHAGLLADGLRGPVTAPQSEALDRIQRAARTLVALIDEVLMYARLGRETAIVNRTSVDLCETGHDVVALVEHIFDAKGLLLRFERPSAPCLVRTDPLKVSHILLNLLTNAAKFTPSGTVTVTVRATDAGVAIDVRDSGIGISHENQMRVFDAFVQLNQQRARSAEGAGLGLTTARRLARLLGGDLAVTSDLGHGSTFTLNLPAEISSTGDRSQTTTVKTVATLP